MIFATSQRCYLRPWNQEDSQALFMLNADDRVMKYTGDPPFRSIQASSDFIATYQQVYQLTGLGRMAIISKADEKNLGWCGFRKNEDGRIDIGFRLLYQAWGKGFASESARSCLELADKQGFLGEVTARAHPDNRNSHKLIERLGFVKDAIRDDSDSEGFLNYCLQL